MNSIREKAEEYSLIEEGTYLNGVPYKDCNSHKMEGFEAGANYVLSVLYDVAYKEDWITNPKDGIRRFFEIYRQLKK